MHKDELLALHQNFVSVKQLLSTYPDVPADAFSEYEALDIRPEDTHEPKIKHRLAIFTLGSELADVISDGDMTDADTIGNRMQELAENTAAKV